MRINPESVKNILLVRNDRLGEFILNIPAFRAIMARFPNAKATVVVNPYLRELARHVDCVNEVIIWENKKHKLSEIVKFCRQIRKNKYDMCVIFNPSQEFNIISFFAGIPVRIGYNRKSGCLLTHKISDKKHIGDTHEIEYNLELAALSGAKVNCQELFLDIGGDLGWGGIDLPEHSPFIALHPWTSDAVKEWPINNFCALAKRIAAELNIKVFIIGARAGRQKDIQLPQNLGPGIVDITDKTTLIHLAGILKKCSLLISADSGPVHLASAVKAPVLAIFRNDMPGKTSKRWGPWGKGHIVVEKSDLCDITVNEVFDKVKEFFERKYNICV